MSSSLNRQNIPPAIQGSSSAQSLTSGAPSNFPNTHRGRSNRGASRSAPCNKGGTSGLVSNHGGLLQQQQQRQNPHHRGGKRGRNPPKGRRIGPIECDQNADPNAERPSGTDSHETQSAVCSQAEDKSRSDNLDPSHQLQLHQQQSIHVASGCNSEQITQVDATAGMPSSGRVLNQSVNKDVSKTTRAVGGKYKQRREARQLIDGLDGFDINLFESLTPSNTDLNMRSKHQSNVRKINLSQLVNHSYHRNQRGGNRRDSASSEFNERITQQGSSQHYHHYNRYHNEHKFSKQQFLQANCQFVVLDGYDYTIHKVDPDWPVDWDCIEEVRFRQIGATETNCPICLEPPVAAKITRCGHIYCWACMLRYLSMSEENKVPCPICFEPIYGSDLRSVVSQSYPYHAIGEEISMKLMLRRKGCVEVEPYSNLSYSSGSDRSLTSPGFKMDKPHNNSQANLIIVDPKTVIEEVSKREKNELQFKLDIEKADEFDAATNSYSGMICFLEQALGKVEERVNRLMQLTTDEVRRLRIERKRSPKHPSDHPECAGRSYSFYQSIDGQHIYLNPFSTKILCQEYGSLECSPTEIRAEILQIDWISMNEHWRKRFKYLEHLPLSCEFRLIEIDFKKSNLISSDTFKLFEEQINSRAKERKRRILEEVKRDKQIQVEQNRKIYGIQPSLEISLDNREQFPSVSNELYLGLDRSRNHILEHDSELVDEPEDQNQSDGISADPTGKLTVSFAEIQLQEAARAEKAQMEKRRHAQSESGPWSGHSSRGTSDCINQSVQQSSFAQLLVDAKSSQQKWTTTVDPSAKSSSLTSRDRAMHTIPGSSQQPGSTQAKSNRGADDLDEGGEELRAPPCEFTISDYLDLNISSGKKRGRSKKKQ